MRNDFDWRSYKLCQGDMPRFLFTLIKSCTTPPGSEEGRPAGPTTQEVVKEIGRETGTFWSKNYVDRVLKCYAEAGYLLRDTTKLPHGGYGSTRWRVTQKAEDAVREAYHRGSDVALENGEE